LCHENASNSRRANSNFISILTCFQARKTTRPIERAILGYRFQVKVEIPHDTKSERQRLDLYLQGIWSGKSNYFSTSDSPRPTLVQIHGGGWNSGDMADVANWVMPYVDQALHLHEALGKNSVRHQLFTLNGGTHGGFTDAQYKESFTEIFKFLKDLGIN
jgi:acetyl esterase/lipase